MLALIAGLAVCTYLTFPKKQSLSPKHEKKVSGAYEALDFFGMSRTYPETRFPAKAHFDAWARTKRTARGRDL